jgi:glycerophosphoryl diester phosphodiesterase
VIIMASFASFGDALVAGRRPLVGAHRGASAHFPENTPAAFAAALAGRADFWELDVRLSADGVAVVIHDDTLDRTTTGCGPVSALNADALADYGVPTLAAVLALGAGKTFFNIEVKPAGDYAALTDATLTAVDRLGLAPAVLISSFAPAVLPLAKRLHPEILTGLLYEEHLAQPVETAVKLGANALHPYFRLTSAALVKAAGHAGLHVIPWTVDRPLYWRYFAAVGAAGVITNRPAAAAALLAARPKQATGD